MRDLLLSLGDFLDVLHDGALVVDRHGRIVVANRAIGALFGHEAQELVGGPLSRLIPHAHRVRHDEQVRAFREHGKSTSMGDRPLLHGLHRAGHEVAVSISLSNVDLPDGRYTIAIVRDAAPVKNEIGQALAQAETDPLTGLGNRLHLSRRLHEAVAAGRPFTVVYIDLAGFKPINDRHGHAAGDELLRVIGRRLRHAVREVDTAARPGGDEFVLLLDGLGDPPAVEARVAAVAAQIAEPVHLAGGRLLQVDADLGTATWPRDGATPDALLAHADAAMYAAKQARRPHRPRA